jgi:manganese oxidase
MKPNPSRPSRRTALGIAAALLLLVSAGASRAEILGLTGTTFDFVAKADYISTPDGNYIYTWGFANGAGGTMQYPGPTLIVNQGDTVIVTLRNAITIPGPPAVAGPNVSLLFPGQSGILASGGVAGALTQEAPADGTTSVTYTFVASQPGTYTYFSGTSMDLELEMGLFGALIVRPTGYDPGVAANRRAYADPASRYDHEYLFLLSEMDPDLHPHVEFNDGLADFTKYKANNWFINGRCGPDTLSDALVPYLPNQPYNCAPRTHPGEKVLMRVIGASRDLHPLHHHGNNAWQIAKDGRMLESVPGVSGPDLAVSDFTITSAPGETVDAIWEWEGHHLGWDVFGHTMGVINSDPNAQFQPFEIYAQSTLASAISGTATSIAVPAGTGRAFLPYPRDFRAILWGAAYANPDLDPNREVVKVSRPIGTPDTFTLVRGQEGTVARAWPAGTLFADTDHGRPLPVTLPSIQNLSFGDYASGTPYLGASGPLPPLQGGFDPNAGYFYMFHSHNELEITNNNVFPGGMLTMMAVEPPGVPIP